MPDTALDAAWFAAPGRIGHFDSVMRRETITRRETVTRREIAGQRLLLVHTDAMLCARTDAILYAHSVPAPLAQVNRLVLLGDHSSLHAAAAARNWVEQLAHLPCDVELAGEWRHRSAPLSPGSVGVLVNPSGKSDNILAALALLQSRGLPALAITAAHHSALAGTAELLWPTAAHEERGSTATGSFTTALMALVRLGLAIGLLRGQIDEVAASRVTQQLADAGIACALTEAAEARCATIGCRLARAGEARFGGRYWCAAMAAEGALNLRDLCPMPAEALTGDALRLQPVHPGVPVVICAAADAQVGQAVADAMSVRARGGHVTVLTDAGSAAAFHEAANETLALPGRGIAHAFAQAVALQLIAYHAALALGHNIDRMV